MYRSRVRTEPTNATAPQWANALWASLETLVEELTASCIKVRALLIPFAVSMANEHSSFPKVYSLEKVLKLKKDTVLKTPFLDEAMKVSLCSFAYLTHLKPLPLNFVEPGEQANIYILDDSSSWA